MRTVILSFLLLLPVLLVSQTTAQDYIQAGVELHDNKQYDDALAAYKQALKQRPKWALAYYEMGLTYYAMGNYKKAIKYCKKVLKTPNTYHASAYNMIGNAYDERGKPEKALETYRTAIAELPDEHMLYFNAAVTLSRLGREPEAYQYLLASLHHNPLHPSSLFYAAGIQAEYGDKAESVMSYLFFLMAEPNSERSKVALKALAELQAPTSSLNIQMGQSEDGETLEPDATLRRSGLPDDDLRVLAGPSTMKRMLQGMKVIEASSITDSLCSADSLSEQACFEQFVDVFVQQFVGDEQALSKGKDESISLRSDYRDVYLPTLAHLRSEGQLDNFCKFVSLSRKGASNAEWLKEHEAETEALVEALKAAPIAQE